MSRNGFFRTWIEIPPRKSGTEPFDSAKCCVERPGTGPEPVERSDPAKMGTPRGIGVPACKKELAAVLSWSHLHPRPSRQFALAGVEG